MGRTDLQFENDDHDDSAGMDVPIRKAATFNDANFPMVGGGGLGVHTEPTRTRKKAPPAAARRLFSGLPKSSTRQGAPF